MSENENYTINDLMKKITLICKNIKTLNDMIKSIDYKMKPVEPVDNKCKEEMDEIFKQKSIGRPKGDHQTKRQQYYDMVVSNKIKQPKQQTLDYYKTTKMIMENMY